MTLIFRTRAIQDLRSIFAHIARYTDSGHAYEVLSDLRVQINALADNPDMRRRGHRRGERFLIVRVGAQTYRCTYRVRGQTVYVVRIRDTRRQGG